jgi:16S rRNA G527 N7-methylase RsmG
VVARTAQEAARDPRFNGAHSLATARALAAPDTAFPWMLPLVRNGGAALVFSGRGSAVPDGAEAWGPGLAIVRKEDSKGEVGGEGGNREP